MSDLVKNFDDKYAAASRHLSLTTAYVLHISRTLHITVLVVLASVVSNPSNLDIWNGIITIIDSHNSKTYLVVHVSESSGS